MSSSVSLSLSSCFIYFPRFLSFLFLSVCSFCFLVGAPSDEWMTVDNQSKWGLFGMCNYNSNINDYECITLTDVELDSLKNSFCYPPSLNSSSPISPPPLNPFGGDGSPCEGIFSEWKASQAVDVIALLSSFVSAFLLFIQAVSSVRGVSLRLQRCCRRSAPTVGTFLSWAALLMTTVTAVMALATTAISHDLLDKIEDNLSNESKGVLHGVYHWPWFSSVCGTTFAWIGLLFGIVFNSAAKLRRILNAPLDPELEAYEDATYIRVGNEAALVNDTQGMFGHTRNTRNEHGEL